MHAEEIVTGGAGAGDDAAGRSGDNSRVGCRERKPLFQGAVWQAGAVYRRGNPPRNGPRGLALLRSVRDRPASKQALHNHGPRRMGTHWHSPLPCPSDPRKFILRQTPPCAGGATAILTESGLQKLQDTADPRFPHSYDWYVMEDCSTAYAQFTDGLSLEDAIQRYAP